jgi:very-short-patch-repair endonuclease
MLYDNNWFINKSKTIHDDKYDYSLVDYKSLRTKVKIICIKHGEFEQTPEKHFRNRGCPYCGGSMRLSLSNFIKRSNQIHNNYYNYTLVDYKNSHTKVKILCTKHGEFEQVPYAHLNGSGCNKCSTNVNNFIQIANKKHKNKFDYSLTNYKNIYTKVEIICPKHGKFEQFPQSHIDVGCVLCTREDSFIKKSKIRHNSKYDYSVVNYKDKYTKVKIICPVHGEFEQAVIYHMRGSGCKSCSDDDKKLDTNTFIEKSKKIHGNKYDYSLVKYSGTFNKVKIICETHGEFNLTPNDHINGTKRGCSFCNESTGEKQIAKILKENNIIFNRQQKFDECVNILKLSYDFYLPNYNLCIEYDGIQHFLPIEYFGGDKKLKKTKINDDIKTNFCIKNDIKLIRIKYTEDVLQKLKTELLEIII